MAKTGLTQMFMQGNNSSAAVPQAYYELLANAASRSPNWAAACSNSECTLHQLSPYIGKLKSSIARDLIEQFSRPGDVVWDPFAGSGTIPLEAALLRRRVMATDASLYAATLIGGKLLAPKNCEEALERAEAMISLAETKPQPALPDVPQWVRDFFHPETLGAAIRLAQVLKQAGDSFLMGCFLGILHHQRPGFLSYPSSHLVPYLRDKLFPCEDFPELYGPRDIRPRMLAKIKRAFKRPPAINVAGNVVACRHQRIQDLTLPMKYDCLITSPPYMNALDYGRDNRLRLWFLGEERSSLLDRRMNGREEFHDALTCVAKMIEQDLNSGGHAVFVVGEHDARGRDHYPSAEVAAIMDMHAPSARLTRIIADNIPDVRRSRRRLAGVKKEHILVYRKDANA